MEAKEEKKSSQGKNMVLITLVFLLLAFIALSGYYSFQLSEEKKVTQEKSRENAELMAKLRDPLLERTIENAKVTSVNIPQKKIAVQGMGKDMTFTVTNSSSIQKVVLAMDKKTRVWQDAKLSDIKKGEKVTIKYNGLKEVVYISFQGK